MFYNFLLQRKLKRSSLRVNVTANARVIHIYNINNSCLSHIYLHAVKVIKLSTKVIKNAQNTIYLKIL